MSYFMGIDPGQSGAYVIIDADGGVVDWRKGSETCRDRKDMISAYPEIRYAVLEKVHSMPKQGVASSFKFGASFGEAVAILETLDIRHELATPQKWQKEMGCMSRGDKNVTKHAAQRFFPGEKITHANADALLLAEYARRRAIVLGLWEADNGR